MKAEDYGLILQDNYACVTIKKKSTGEERKMYCTLKNEHLPVVEKKPEDENKPKRKINLNQVNVWDLEKKGWRSFMVDTVLDFTVMEEEPNFD